MVMRMCVCLTITVNCERSASATGTDGFGGRVVDADHYYVTSGLHCT